jgi:sugar transferase (PEP-CTERM/EpsH1 system associated)
MTAPARAAICQVLHSLNIGGAEVLAAGIARALRDRYRFVFACLDGLGSIGEQLRDEGFEIEVLDRKDGIDWKCGFRLARFLKQHAVDIVHAHQYTPFFQSMLSRLSYRGVPIVFTEHGRHHPDSRSLKRVAVNRLLSQRSDRFVAVGQSVRQALIDNEGLAARRVEVIYNGVDQKPFRAVRNTASRKSVRSELNVPDDEFLVIQVARLNPLKDHLTAVESIAKLVDKKIPVRLILVGEGETQSEIERTIDQLGLTRNVQLLGTRQDIPELLSAADAFLLSSISEGIPLTIIEAMAAGIPVVATDVGGNSEVIENGRTGLLCSAKDSSFMAQQLTELYESHDLRNMLAENAMARAQELFDIDQMHDAYVGVYDSMLGHQATSKTVKREPVLP